jgi:ParB family chromosome partitioning protein
MMRPLQIVYRKTSQLVPYARNARKHSDAQVSQIAGSIREFGFTNPVLIDERSSIIAGHGRVMAAHKLQLDEVPTVELAGLSDTQRRAYVLADNKLGLNASWDCEMLLLELDELKAMDFDVSIAGWSDDEREQLSKELAADFSPSDQDEQGELDKMSPQIVKCPECGHEWDRQTTKT